MNQFLPERFVENVQRLALGLVPIDAERRTRVVHPFRITFDQTARGLRRPPVERHASCLHVLRYHPGLTGPVDLRLFDSRRPLYHPDHDRRRFVPRRLRIPILTEAAADNQPYTFRVRQLGLFPGAAYDVSESATGLRGRVLRGGQPMRWAWVVATIPNRNVVVGRTQGDDHGEFLLLIGAAGLPPGDLVDPLAIQVTVFGPNPVPVPAFPELPALDPLWDLPLEQASAPGIADPVSAGTHLPPDYTAAASQIVDFQLGVLRSGVPAFVI
jgi:hypothetical protein